jgi:hypothetical protein
MAWPDAPCPTIKDLVREDILSRSSRPPLRDPWDEPYRIECFGEADVEVRSAGPDGLFATSDDITAASRPRTERVTMSDPEAATAECVGGDGC